MTHVYHTEIMAPQNWLQHGIQGQSKTIRPLWQKYEDENISKILGLPSGRHKAHGKQSCTLCDTTVRGHVLNTGNGKPIHYEAVLGYNWCRS